MDAPQIETPRVRVGGGPLCGDSGGATLTPMARCLLRRSGLWGGFMIRKILTAASIAAAALAMTLAASAQEIKLTLADQNSPTGWGPAHALAPWVKQVEEATKGRVKIEVFPSQTLIKGIDMWKGIRSGIADTSAGACRAIGPSRRRCRT
jgi:hypothetical protein